MIKFARNRVVIMKPIFKWFSLVILYIFFLAACSSVTTDPSETYKGESPQQIFKTGKESLQEKSYSEAIKRFEALDIQYPYGEETERAQLYLIYAYYMKEDYPLSSAAAERFIRLHPLNPFVDYAYYMRGIADFYQNMGVLERLFSVDLATRDITQIQKSYHDFSLLTTRFPASRYTPSGHQYMVYLRNVLADQELHIAQFYYDRKAYIAAVDRASSVVAHYQGAPKVIDALILLTKSYQQLGLNKEAQEALLVLRYNYPNINV